MPIAQLWNYGKRSRWSLWK
uniref:Ribosomal protein S6 kinase 90kDa polypeptide 2 isoform A n=1 Tax=Homo sapiens TaxID=9606 RepID=X5DPB4_HUMAN|nr:ribosomal protein S6 kinase 90kDa polypeptide 2 isoform A [Homo sapiens]